MYIILFNSEVASGFFYKSAEEREKLLKAERDFIEKRVLKVIDLKKAVCGDTKKGFVVINQKVKNQCFLCKKIILNSI
jgi:T-complex protein 1 subunit zeta